MCASSYVRKIFILSVKYVALTNIPEGGLLTEFAMRSDTESSGLPLAQDLLTTRAGYSTRGPRRRTAKPHAAGAAGAAQTSSHKISPFSQLNMAPWRVCTACAPWEGWAEDAGAPRVVSRRRDLRCRTRPMGSRGIRSGSDGLAVDTTRSCAGRTHQ